MLRSAAQEMHGAFELCPGMVVTGLLLAAEALLFSMAPSARDPLQLAKSYMQFLQHGLENSRFVSFFAARYSVKSCQKA